MIERTIEVDYWSPDHPPFIALRGFEAGLHVLGVLEDLVDSGGPDNAAIFQDTIEYHLRRAGMNVTREFPCLKPSGRRGRIDLVVNNVVALELDWKLPRYNSLAKLRQFDGYRIVVLRCADPWPHELPLGIDDIVCIPVVDTLDIIRDPKIAARMMPSS